jgi:2-hydroxy-3-keto-5-methylthiopentenyl-1-phosphate phosphatase
MPTIDLSKAGITLNEKDLSVEIIKLLNRKLGYKESKSIYEYSIREDIVWTKGDGLTSLATKDKETISLFKAAELLNKLDKKMDYRGQ